MGSKISFGKELLSNGDISLEHLGEEDVIDFNIMCRESVMEERWWEHHVVSVIPELDAILGIEAILLTRFGESASSENEDGSETIGEKTGVVE